MLPAPRYANDYRERESGGIFMWCVRFAATHSACDGLLGFEVQAQKRKTVADVQHTADLLTIPR